MTTVLLEKNDGVATITLNRPDVFNSFNGELAAEVKEALNDCNEDETVRAIVLTGAGKAFCAGQDLQEIVGENAPSLSVILSERLNPLVELIRAIEKPIIAAVNGVAAGAGANIALICDVTIAKESTSFIQAFSKIGLIPDSGGTYFLPRLIGPQRAMALMMTGDKLPAAEAEKMGLIYKAVPDASFYEEVESFAQKIAKMPTKALGLTKRAMNYSFENTLERQLAIEDNLQSEASLTEDFAEGVAAFVEKRRPVFKGK